jgi:hypothetical protein
MAIGITKYVLPVVVGSMSGMILITMGAMLMHKQYPLPAGTDLYDADSLALAMKQMPSGYYICLLVNNSVCSFLAGLIASLVSGRISAVPVFIVGFVLTLSGLYYNVVLPYPMWVCAANLLVYIPLAWLGYFAVKQRPAAENNDPMRISVNK